MEEKKPENEEEHEEKVTEEIEEDEKDTQLLRVTRESGIYTPGKVETLPVDWLVDTGCTTTIVSARVFNALHPEDRPNLQTFDGKLTSVDGSDVKVLGRAVVNIKIGPKSIRHRVIVADVLNQGILGVDILQQHKMTLNFATKTLQSDDCDIKLKCQAGTFRACRVSVSEHTVIPAGSRTVLRAKASKPLADGSWLIEPLHRTPGEKLLFTAKSLVEGRGTFVPVEVLNPTEEDICLYRHTNLGVVTRVAEHDVLHTLETKPTLECAESAHQDVQLPEEVQKLIDGAEADLSEAQKIKIKDLLQDNLDVFATKDKPFGRTDLVKHRIVTETDVPIKQPVRRPPLHLRTEAKNEVQKMLENEIIEPSDSPWASPVVLVRKKDGSLRYCVDYRRLNSVTRKDSYPLPRIDESLDSLAQTEYFSTLDLASGYWQIGLDEDAKQKSAFCTTSGLFQFKVMPFGLTNAPATFQRLMERILTGLQWETCLVYIDDIIIYSKTFKDHIQHLAEVFRRLKCADLKLKPKKCNIFKRQVSYLGHIVSKEGISTDPSKTKDIDEWPQPSTVTEVKRFLGLCSYYRRFVPDFATVAKPLIVLTEKNVPFRWTQQQDDAWTTLKKSLTEAPVMAYPDPSATFVLDTDASQDGIGAVLSQIIDGEEKVISYGSRVLSKPERRYCITRRELLAAVFFVKYFRHYLVGKEFILRTDHASLRWLRSFKEPEGQLARWLETLDIYNFKIEHRPGAKHGNADALSRMHCEQCGMDHEGYKTRRGRRPKVEDSTAQAVKTRSQAQKHPLPDVTTNWLPNTELSREELQQAQQADPLLSTVIKWIEKGERPEYKEIAAEGQEARFYWAQFDSLKIVGGVLTREVDLPNVTSRRQICLPPSKREEAMKTCHENLTAGHFGHRKTHLILKRRFIWPGMAKSVLLFVLSCDTCAAYKTDGKKRRAKLKTQVTGVPMERVCVDIVGPFPESTAGNKYGLVVTDYFTKYVEMYAMPNQEAATVASVLTREFFSRYGVPNYLHSDQGTQFESKLFAEVCNLLGICKTRTTPFRPQSDGQSERNIKTLSRMVAMMTEDQKEWDEYLPFLSMAYRTTPQDSTGLTPNFLMYGREVSMPVDVMIGPPEDQPVSEIDYVKRMQKKLTYAYDLARKNLKQAAERQTKYYNRSKHGNAFSCGDLVWYANKLRKKGVSPKLQPKWKGPCLVVKRHNDALVQIQSGAKKFINVHTDLLKPCYSKKRPRWLKRALKSLTV